MKQTSTKRKLFIIICGLLLSAPYLVSYCWNICHLRATEIMFNRINRGLKTHNLHVFISFDENNVFFSSMLVKNVLMRQSNKKKNKFSW